MGAPVTWFEISTSKSKALRDFYAKIFGWKLQVLDDVGYALVDTQAEHGIGGGIGEAGGPNQVTFYIEVDDPQAYLDRIEKAGGKTAVPVTEIPNMVPFREGARRRRGGPGAFAQFTDPQGNVVGLVKRSD